MKKLLIIMILFIGCEKCNQVIYGDQFGSVHKCEKLRPIKAWAVFDEDGVIQLASCALEPELSQDFFLDCMCDVHSWVELEVSGYTVKRIKILVEE